MFRSENMLQERERRESWTYPDSEGKAAGCLAWWSISFPMEFLRAVIIAYQSGLVKQSFRDNYCLSFSSFKPSSFVRLHISRPTWIRRTLILRLLICACKKTKQAETMSKASFFIVSWRGERERTLTPTECANSKRTFRFIYEVLWWFSITNNICFALILVHCFVLETQTAA